MTSVRRLVAGTLVTGFAEPSLPTWLARELEAGLGGVCWFAQNVEGGTQAARELADAIHTAGGHAVVMSDEEGGDVTRLEAATGSSWPGHAALGALNDTAATRAVATGLGGLLRDAGVDITLAPVVDVNSNPDNPVIGVRSFGATPELVARHAAAFVEALQSQGVAGCAKHFPGHGSTIVDSHRGLPRVDDSESVIRERDLAPFEAVVRAGVRTVMTAHVVFSAFDEQPATLSPRMIEILRKELGFDGVVISDALDMDAISAGVGREEGAVRSLLAGVDVLCIGNPGYPSGYDPADRLARIAAAVESAVDEGRLPVSRLEEAAARVAVLKEWLRTVPHPSSTGDARSAAVDAARRSLTVRGEPRLSSTGARILDLGGDVNIAAGQQDRHLVAAMLLRDRTAEAVDVTESTKLFEAVRDAESRPLVVVVRQPRKPEARAALSEISTTRPDVVVVCTGVEGPGTDLPVPNVVWSHGGGRAVADAVADVLTEALSRNRTEGGAG